MPGGRLLPELGLEMWTNRCRLNLYGGFFSCIDTGRAPNFTHRDSETLALRPGKTLMAFLPEGMIRNFIIAIMVDIFFLCKVWPRALISLALSLDGVTS